MKTLLRRTRLIAVSQRVDQVPGRDETRDALDQALTVWLISVGCVPLPVPNRLRSAPAAVDLDTWLTETAPAAILLSGGNDIGDFPERDATEMALLDWAVLERKPVLGICRGMQVLGVRAGGKLVPVTGHVRTLHQLGDAWPGEVNSFHKFAFTQCPPEYRVLVRSEDGAIEAIRHATLPWEGWMWHPERAPTRGQDIERFLELLTHD